MIRHPAFYFQVFRTVNNSHITTRLSLGYLSINLVKQGTDKPTLKSHASKNHKRFFLAMANLKAKEKLITMYCIETSWILYANKTKDSDLPRFQHIGGEM